MAEYIDREVVLNILSQKNAPWDGYQKVSELPVADVVSKAAYDQVAWERHLAEVQLKSIGKSLGEKMDDVQPVKHGGKWVNDIQCSNCGWYMEDDVTMSPMIVFFDYCPNCGARMDG